MLDSPLPGVFPPRFFTACPSPPCKAQSAQDSLKELFWFPPQTGKQPPAGPPSLHVALSEPVTFTRGPGCHSPVPHHRKVKPVLCFSRCCVPGFNTGPAIIKLQSSG